jgi:hypothetical protein
MNDENQESEAPDGHGDFNYTYFHHCTWFRLPHSIKPRLVLYLTRKETYDQ